MSVLSFFSTHKKNILKYLAILIVVLIVVLASKSFIYLFNTVEQQEIGVQFRGGRIYRVVGPGIYSDVGLFVKMEKVSSQAIPFSVSDEEIITKDKQRIGLVVSGDIFRPNLAQKDILLSAWAQYRGVFLDDALAQSRIKDFSRQAMKVCVGDRTFDDNIIGTSRDDLRNCIDDEVNQLADQVGLTVKNLVVPEVVLSPEVQAALDSIVQSRLATEKAAQDKLKAEAEASAEQAKQEGEIRVEQSRIQEKTRQEVLLAQLEQERLAAEKLVVEAEMQVIEATKANELLSAESDLKINEALALAAEAKAQGDLAEKVALAELLASHPGYLQLLIAQANAAALTEADKIIFTVEGSTPSIVMPGPGITPTVNTFPQ